MELRYHGSAMPYRSCYLYIGQQLNGRLKVKFDNPYLFVAAVLVVYESSLLIGPVGLNHNSYKDVLQLTVGSTYLRFMPFVSFRKTGEVAYRESVGSVWQGIFFTSWDYTS